MLASDRDPAVSEAFSEADYRAVAQVLENFYSICLTDCGTGLLHSAMSGVLGLADQLVLVSSPSVDGARAASATLDWLEAHHYGDLVAAATVVLCSVRAAVEVHGRPRPAGGALRRAAAAPWSASRTTRTWRRAPRSTWTACSRPRGTPTCVLAASVGDGFAGLQALTARR